MGEGRQAAALTLCWQGLGDTLSRTGGGKADLDSKSSFSTILTLFGQAGTFSKEGMIKQKQYAVFSK